MWEKKGVIYSSKGQFEWNLTHAQVPIVDTDYENKWRIYYSSRNKYGKSNLSYIDVEQGNPSKILYIHDRPILDLGKPGTFDDSGIMPTSIITIKGKKYLYYIGWTEKINVPYQNSIGLAIFEDDNLKKVSEGPIIGVDRFDPYFTGTCYVQKIDNYFVAYYLSCIGWEKIENKMEPLYDLKISTSSDGIIWVKEGKIAIPLIENEGGIASASIIKEGNIYKMWYSVRNKADFRTNISNSYRIGYAESSDAFNWKRLDINSGIERSFEGWDSEMIAYPNVVTYNNKYYMFYNGNGFGQSGFGFAEQLIK